ncbi:S41 family peptidase [Zhaonella formicivorans]|uniref:S41 family peptidase n=1 Tax=Zhaonella formicivorans TaxID=2528593 RepID=UPI001D12AF9F|nr:S41 family peptidase [Zhaonella formicivorans]
MEQRRTTLKTLLTAFAIFSMIFTASLGVAALTNLGNIGRAVKVIALIKMKAIQPVSASQLIEGAAAGMVGSLNDPYSTYLAPEPFESLMEHLKGSYGGVGLLVSMEKENRLTVVSPFKGTPAQKAGILSGDWIVKIDGQETTNMTLEKAAQLMQGKPGTKVTLTVWREGLEGLKDYVLTRQIINIPSVEGQLLKKNRDIAYINITQFSENTGTELERVLKELGEQGFKGIVLDLRNNPGGELEAALQVASKFVPEGPIVHIVEKQRTETLMARGGNLKVPLVVLVNKGSASASEIVSGAIKDTKAGILVGEKTFGKGLVQTVFPLSGGAALKLTTAKYLTPNKTDINKKGIEPNVKVELPQELEREIALTSPNEDKDPQLRKAIEILRTKIK